MLKQRSTSNYSQCFCVFFPHMNENKFRFLHELNYYFFFFFFNHWLCVLNRNPFTFTALRFVTMVLWINSYHTTHGGLCGKIPYEIRWYIILLTYISVWWWIFRFLHKPFSFVSLFIYPSGGGYSLILAHVSIE